MNFKFFNNLFSFFLGMLFLNSCNKLHERDSVPFYEIKEVEECSYFETKVTLKNIKGGSYTPLYGNDSLPTIVDDFFIDEYPVTNSDYLNFLKANKHWQKSTMKKIFADKNYLNSWTSDTSFPESMHPNSPVTNVSWYAAKAYCECLGKRLPTLDEWEYVAMADEKIPDARINDDYNEKILSWYEKPKTFHNQVGETTGNYWGVKDLHGLVWEWTLDFNSVMVTGESRKEGQTDNNLFCGGSSLGASDLMNYAAFMRFAFRGSLKAGYSVKNLGFRCATNKI